MWMQWPSTKSNNETLQEYGFVWIQKTDRGACWIVNEGGLFSMHDWSSCITVARYIQHPIRPCSHCLSVSPSHTCTRTHTLTHTLCMETKNTLSHSLSCKGTFELLHTRVPDLTSMMTVLLWDLKLGPHDRFMPFSVTFLFYLYSYKIFIAFYSIRNQL